jgi:hypothetical protein
VYISGNAARGKVVFYDATNEDDGRDVVYTGCSVPFGCATCPGDLSGDNQKTLTDLYQLRGKLMQEKSENDDYEILKGDVRWDVCGDMNLDDKLTLTDLYQLRGQLMQSKSIDDDYVVPCGMTH